MIEIYEKKHVFRAVMDGALMLFILVASVAILCALVSPSTVIHYDYGWVSHALIWLLVVLLVLIFGLCGFHGWFLLDRYITLCLSHKPAVIMTDSELKIYTPFRGYTEVNWSEIVDFKYVALTKFRRGYYPVYKAPELNKGTYKKCYTETILTDFLTLPDQQLLEELNKHIGK